MGGGTLSDRPRVLVVGAGAVGTAFGHALRKGGAELSFLVRPRYAEEVRQGIRVWSLVRGGAVAGRLVPDRVHEDVAGLGEASFDQVWLCVPTTGLQEGWLGELARATGDALVVDPSPDATRRALRVVGSARVVEGLIPFIAYQTPLAGTVEAGRAPGIAVWLPPLSPVPLSGPRAREAAGALRSGGMPARVVRDVSRARAFGGSLLNVVMAELELAGWSLSRLARQLDDAPAEAMRVVSRQLGLRAGPVGIAARRPWAGLLLRLAPQLVPLPLEAYLRHHFTKLGAQTRESLAALLAAADGAAMEVPHLRRLAARLGAA